MWHHSHDVLAGEKTPLSAGFCIPVGRIPVGMLEIELSCRTGALSTDWATCPEGILRNGKQHKLWVITDKLLQKGQGVIAIPAQLLSQLLPVDRLESQCRFRREWQPNSLLSISSASAVMRISHVSSPVLQVPCPPEAVAGTGPQTGHSSACSHQTWEQGVTEGWAHPLNPNWGCVCPWEGVKQKNIKGKMIVDSLCPSSPFSA